MKKQKKDVTTISAQVTVEQKEKLEKMAEEEDRTISYLVRKALSQFLGLF